MKTRLLNLAFILLASVLAISCRHHEIEGRGPVSTVDRKPGSFTSVTISTSVHATIVVDAAATPSVQLTGYTNLLDHIHTEVSGDELVIKTPENEWISTDKDIEAKITVPSLKALSISGSADADINGNLKGESFEVSVSGSGNVKVSSLEVNDLKFHISGAGNLAVKSGTATTASYHISGSGGVDAFGLVTQDATIHVSGSGSLELNAARNLDVHISGSGNVDYKGHPTIQSHISGGGELQDKNKGE